MVFTAKYHCLLQNRRLKYHLEHLLSRDIDHFIDRLQRCLNHNLNRYQYFYFIATIMSCSCIYIVHIYSETDRLKLHLTADLASTEGEVLSISKKFRSSKVSYSLAPLTSLPSLVQALDRCQLVHVPPALRPKLVFFD